MPARAALFGIFPAEWYVTAKTFPQGKLLWLRYVLPFNAPGLLSNLGREDDVLPYRDGAKMYLFPPQKRHRAGQGRG